ncbi:hypothetical protein IWQ62_005910 [Dispira parvispora]|uniref:Calcipressin n=1 Tax=Dispira parvispora TaxID=1520584 RepID=A0A9W8APJ1_9FUNG|nr:hypothetical protein IWQ62_005910 [Dispira parvispora]
MSLTQPPSVAQTNDDTQSTAGHRLLTTVDFITPALVVTFAPYNPSWSAKLKQVLDTRFGPVVYFTALSSFSRCLVILESREKASRARRFLTDENWLEQPGVTVHAYYYQIDPSDPSVTTKDYLRLPENERLWLISPPGSPPVGWEQEREEPPNTDQLPDELHQALLDLGDGRLCLRCSSSASDPENARHHTHSDGEGTTSTGVSVNTLVPMLDNLSTTSGQAQLGLPTLTDFPTSQSEQVSPSTPYNRPIPDIIIEPWDKSQASQSDSLSLPTGFRGKLPRTALPKR